MTHFLHSFFKCRTLLAFFPIFFFMRLQNARVYNNYPQTQFFNNWQPNNANHIDKEPTAIGRTDPAYKGRERRVAN